MRSRPALLTTLIVALLGTAICFRLMDLSSIPGISGDEGWWGVQAIAWVSHRPYETHTTSGNPIDLFFLIPLALVNVIDVGIAIILRQELGWSPFWAMLLMTLVTLGVAMWLASEGAKPASTLQPADTEI